MLLILDRGDGELPPYGEWLDGAAAVLFTARGESELAGCDLDDYAEVRTFADYASATRLDRDAVALAQDHNVSAIVAVAPEDAVRAGGLRDLLGVSGRGRREAVALRDLVALRDRLERAGLATVQCAPVERVSDVYWHAERLGYPLRVRRRRTLGWTVVAELCDELDTRAFTRGGLSAQLESVPSLLVEAISDDERRIRMTRRADGRWDVPPGCPWPALALARDGLALLAPSDGGAWTVQVASPGAGCDWRINTVVERSAGRELARMQAGLGTRMLEVVR